MYLEKNEEIQKDSPVFNWLITTINKFKFRSWNKKYLKEHLLKQFASFNKTLNKYNKLKIS